MTLCLLHKLWSFNKTENAVYNRSNAAVLKYLHGYKYMLNAEEIWFVFDMVMILNFLEKLLSNSRKFKMITISTTDHISSAFCLYSEPCTYSKITFVALHFTEFSIPFDGRNLSKRTESLYTNQIM